MPLSPLMEVPIIIERISRHRRLTAALPAAALILVLAFVRQMVTTIAVPSFAAVRAQYVPSEAYLVDRHGEVLESQRLNLGVRRFAWVALDGISPALERAVIEAEDRRFFAHHGFDGWAVLAAVKEKLIGHRHRGASTITMQLAGLIRGDRRGGGEAQNWQRKFTQVRAARALESTWTKAQILEAYLNLVQFRGDLQGVGAAAAILAGKAPSGLSIGESRTLAALLPDPNAAPDRVASRACVQAHLPPASNECNAIRETSAKLLHRAQQAGASPSLAPQLGSALLRTAGESVQTTLDTAIQRFSIGVMQHHLALLGNHNVRDGAVLVVDNRSGDVLAYVGSGGRLSTASHVDGVRARRQAGSTLKPFLYELSLEDRYLTASSLLEDSPLNLDTGTGVYIPQDYDHAFKGLVSVRTALGSSLNVPAVRTLVLVGVEAFRDRLNSLGYAGIIEDGAYYGYSLALGSAEVSLWEQAQAYRSLARGGRWSPIRIKRGVPEPDDRQPMSAEASFVVGDILADPVARSATFGLDSHLNTPFWSAAKTGTSKDMRDNWCIGYSSDFTVAVWVGNFEGDAMHDVSGVSGAAPIWHDIMLALHRARASTEALPPSGIVQSAIHFSPAVEPPRREWYLAGTQTDRVVALAAAGKMARIVSPANGMIIALDPDIPARSQRIPLTAQGARPGMRIRLNGTVLGSAVEKILWAPAAGAQRLTLEDGEGRAVDRILFTVR
jgi:penicillin-binding protein 1C